MSSNKTIIIAVLIIVLISFLIVFKFALDEFNRRERIEWKENSHGVEYFTTCVEGFLFIATYTSGLDLIGPIGKCDQEGVQR